jgi:hypothetical protein
MFPARTARAFACLAARNCADPRRAAATGERFDGNSKMPILDAIFAHDPGRPAALAGTARITFGRLCADVDSIAHWLFAQGLEPGERITIHPADLGNTGYWDWVMHLGALRAGLVHSTGPMPAAIEESGALGPYKAALGAVAGFRSRRSPH